jgi:SAM-dependent methyltransferase
LHLLRRFFYALLYPRPLIGLLYLPRFFQDLFIYRKASSGETIAWRDLYPSLLDRVIKTPFDPHYFYQGAWLAREVAASGARYHVDIGSSIMTIGALSGFVRTTFVDYRPLQTVLTGLNCQAGDINHLSFEDNSVTSLSCMHVIEHIGLGRYGDPLDPDGSIRAARELQRVLKPGGLLFLSVPVGRERVCFNSHRIFAPDKIQVLFPGLKLISFSYVSDDGHFFTGRPTSEAAGSEYACGMYVFKKEETSD